MIRLFYLKLFILICFTNLFSQNVEKKLDISEIRKNKYQVELGFGSIQSIYRSTASATILFKKKYNPGKLIDVSSIKYLRTYFTINSNISFSKDTIIKRRLSFDPVRYTDISIGFGMEKQFQNRRLVHYFGCDLFANYYNATQLEHYSYLSNFSYYDALYETQRSFNAGLIPFIGIKYYLTDQLSFGLETGFAASYYISKYTDIKYQFDSRNGDEVLSQLEYPPYQENGIRFNFLGIRFITIGYSFNK